MKYFVAEIVGEFCMTAEDGQKLYDLIYPTLKNGNHVELVFTGVNIFASAFCDFAFGQLFKDIPADQVNELLQFIDLNTYGRYVIEAVIENARNYYSINNIPSY